MSAHNEPPGFDAIWHAIRGWDIQREHGAGYHGPTGDDVRAILSALSAAGWVVEQGWQPIETAPRDRRKDENRGPPLQLFQRGFAPMTGCWFQMQGQKTGWWNVGGKPFSPTHWRPLPSPPQEAPHDRS